MLGQTIRGVPVVVELMLVEGGIGLLEQTLELMMTVLLKFQTYFAALAHPFKKY